MQWNIYTCSTAGICVAGSDPGAANSQCCTSARGDSSRYQAREPVLDNGRGAAIGRLGVAINQLQEKAYTRVGTLDYMAPEVCPIP